MWLRVWTEAIILLSYIFPHFILKAHSSTPIIGDNVSCRCQVPQLITSECKKNKKIFDKQYKHFNVRLPQPYLRSLKKEHRENQLFCHVSTTPSPSRLFLLSLTDGQLMRWWVCEGKKLSTIIFGHSGRNAGMEFNVGLVAVLLCLGCVNKKGEGRRQWIIFCGQCHAGRGEK